MTQIPHPAARRARAPGKGRAVLWVVAAAVLMGLGLLAVLGFRGIQRGRESTFESARAAATGAVERAVQVARERLPSRLAMARPLRNYSLVPSPSGSPEIAARYEEALGSPPGESEAAFAALLAAHPDAVTPAGLPLAPIVAWMRLQRAEGEKETAERADALGRAAVVECPSLLSGKLLQQAAALLAERGFPADPLPAWSRQWSEDEAIRQALRNEKLVHGQAAQRWLTTLNKEHWWAESEDGETWRVLPERELQNLASAIAAQADSLLPPASRLSIRWAGRDLRGRAEGERLAERQHEALSVAAYLTDPSELFAEQRRQTIWTASLLGLALAAVLGGFVAMQRALAAERRLNQQQSDFVASVSHELRAPVSSMRLMLENLQSGVVTSDGSRAEYLRLLESECRRLSALIENVLDFARIEHDRKIYEMAEADIAAMIGDVIQLLQPRAVQRKQRLIGELATIEPAPVVDALALQQAVLNLVDNAMKFSPPETTITVQTRNRDDGQWEIVVADEGPGIPAAERSRIFERFYRVGNELRRETQGAGIGLALVKHTVDAHGGRIEVESAAGATFRMILPYRSPAD